VLVEVVAVDGRPVASTRLAVMDAHSIWLSHQAEVAPRSRGRPPAATGLTAAEVPAARELFRSLADGPPWTGPDLARLRGWEIRWGARLEPVLLAVAVAAVIGLFLIWLALKGATVMG
jgi:hypothetical protein